MRLPSTLARLIALAVLLPGAAGAQALSDFDDGTLQGWTLDPISLAGSIGVLAGGNPGFAIESNDCCFGLPTIIVNAPPAFTGDLSALGGVQWDEYLISSPVNQLTSVLLHGTNGTSYRSDFAYDAFPLLTWRTRFSAFQASEWTLCSDVNLTCGSGTDSFASVVSAVARLSIHTEPSSAFGPESRVDNVQLVPQVPALSRGAALALAALLLATVCVGVRRQGVR